MLIRLLCAAACLLASTSLVAQQILGATTEVQGLVTVSTGTTLSNAVPGTPIADGARIVTASGSTATIRLNNDCVLRMRANQSLTVASQKTCEELLALLEPSRGGGLILASSTPSLGQLAAVSALIAGGFVLTNNVGSGNRTPGTSTTDGGGGGGIPNPPTSGQ